MSNYNIDQEPIDIGDISSFIRMSGLLDKSEINKEHVDILNINNESLCDLFEFNRNITVSDASVKYYELLQNLNKIFNMKTTFEEMYNQFINITKVNITLCNFINYLLMFDLIVTNFNTVFGFEEGKVFNDLFENKVNLLEIEIGNNESSLSNKLDNIYNNLLKKSRKNSSNINNNLIILIYILSMDCNFEINKDLPSMAKLMNNFEIYNKLYVSNIYIACVLYMQMILYINLYNNSNKNKKTYFDYTDSKHQSFKEKKLNETINYHNLTTPRINIFKQMQQNSLSNLNTLSFNSFYPSLYLFDNETIKINYTNSIKVFVFQNYLKLYSFYHLSQLNTKITINLNIENLNEFLYNLNQNNPENNNDTKNKNDIFKLKNNNILDNIIVSDLIVFTKENIIEAFQNIEFDELVIKISKIEKENQIKDILMTYNEIIKKAFSFYIRETIISTNIQNSENKIIDDNNMEILYIQFSSLAYLLTFFGKIKDVKSLPSILNFKFNYLKCIINKEKKTIQIYFNFSNIKEKTLFQNLKISSNLLILLQKYILVINSVKEYKLYDTTMRLSQTNFRSHQLSFFFSLIIKKVVDYIKENKIPKINIQETTLNNYKNDMEVYIKDRNLRKKSQINQIRQTLHNFVDYNKIKIFNNFVDDLVDSWDLIVIGNYLDEVNLIRTFEENKLFIYIAHEKSNAPKQINTTLVKDDINNNNKNESNNDNEASEIYEYINVLMYFKNDQDIYNRGLFLIENIQNQKESSLEIRTTLICDRFFLESNILMEPKMKKAVRILYNNVDDIFLIAKNININNNDDDYYNYDVYIADSFIAVANHHAYNVKNDNDNYHQLIYEYLSILSSCMELILYILKNKDIFITKFIYLIRAKNDEYYAFIYKNSNMFIKRLKEFDSLLNMKIKESYPLFCLIPKKEQTTYTLSLDNFYDLFLRLFLNLNKVVETKDKLNEVFFQKIHKNIFHDYYDTFIIIAFNYEAFTFFNDFFMKNDYLILTKNEKFENCYIIPFESFNNIKEYKNILESRDMVKNLQIYNYNFNSNYLFKNYNKIFTTFMKAEYIINEEKSFINTKHKPDINKKIEYFILKLLENKLSKDKIKKITKVLYNLLIKANNITYYNADISEYEEVLEEFIKEKIKIQTQKVEMRVYQLTEEAKISQTNTKTNKKDCIIY